MTAKEIEGQLRERLAELKKTDPVIHIDVAIPRPRVNLEGATARIVGVYPFIFRIEAPAPDGTIQSYSLQYSDIMIGRIKIKELKL